MPTLGFLKKKRTKDSRDLDSPTSPIKDAFSPVTPTSSRNTRASIASKSSANNPAQGASQSTAASTAPSHKPADSMNPSYPQQAYATPQASPEPYQQASSHNVASIQNLIHPSNNANSSAYQQPPQKLANGAPAPSQPAPQPRQTKGKYTLGDFQIQRTLGTGSFGRVHLVQSKHNQRFYAVKVLKKAQVVRMKQVEHTNDERRMLQQVKHPFLITLWGTFQDSKNLYMVMDFVEGGELFSLLRKSQVSLQLVSCLYLLINAAIPEPRRQILRSRSHARPRVPARPKHHLPRPETREPAAGPTRPPQDHRLWFCERGPRHHLDAMRHARLPRA